MVQAMYLPKHFAEPRIDVLHDAIRRSGLATLVSMTEDGLIASHTPLLLDTDSAPYGTLIGHLARPNPQTRGAIGEALAIFHGPDAYVTPSWYPTKQQTGKGLPTGNYVAIHAAGPVEFFDDPDRLLEIVTRLTDRQEASRPDPWAVSDAPADYVQAMLKGITGFTMRITKLEGKWKMNQNRPPADRKGAAEGLRASGRPDVAELIRADPEG
jgi:transcriptional regulator